MVAWINLEDLSEDTIIFTHQLAKNYRRGRTQITSLPPVDLEIKKNESVIIRGKNGSGKSTLLSLLATLISPTSGYCYINGYNLYKDAHKIRNELAYIPEQIDFDYSLTGMKLWKMINAFRGTEPDFTEFNSLAKELHIKPWLEKPVGTYSVGMQKRFLVAAWLSLKPTILLMDELDASLDATGRNEIKDILDRYDTLTIVSVSHLADYEIRENSRIIRFESLLEVKH